MPILTLLFAFFCPPAGQSAVDKKTAADIDREIEKIRPEMIKVRRLIHMDPQLSGREHETAKVVAARLAGLGLDVKTGVAGAGVVALLVGGQPGPTIAVRADLDAAAIQELADVPFKSVNPGVMHAHGHDLHTAIVLGTAYVLSAVKDRVRGGVKFIFQPSAETPPGDEENGAAQMIRAGVLDNPPVRAIFGLHIGPENMGDVSTAPGPLLAGSDVFEIIIKGRSAPGSRPQEGVDAVVLAAQVVAILQTVISRTVDPTDPTLLTIGRIEGGGKADLIAERVRMEGIVRTLNEATRRRVHKSMEAAVRGIVQAFGGDFSLTFKQSIPSVVNHPELFNSMAPVLNDALGDRAYLPVGPQMMADDFAFYGQKIPSFFFFLGARNPRLPATPLYSPYFNPDERVIGIGMKILSHLLLDSLEEQNRLAKDPAGR